MNLGLIPGAQGAAEAQSPFIDQQGDQRDQRALKTTPSCWMHPEFQDEFQEQILTARYPDRLRDVPDGILDTHMGFFFIFFSLQWYLSSVSHSCCFHNNTEWNTTESFVWGCLQGGVCSSKGICSRAFLKVKKKKGEISKPERQNHKDTNVADKWGSWWWEQTDEDIWECSWQPGYLARDPENGEIKGEK